ncbi:hypothetical protein HID58_068821 [Brassica napus]|uniref:C3H1-type domain-containing protein n=1 Tax=Brassica napus TaxID=3708 RepID=A0ABQ7ZMG6_BRANA|nr:hypothetical protein HID58_068821 [Brassica napus]
MERYGRAGEEGSRSDPSLEWTTALQTGVQASVWRAGGESYPERPDEPDCIYYLRTGACGYGSRCRFNHPRDRGAVVGGVRGGGGGGDGALPERMGQPHFMRTGTCKFGATCKYHHPRQGGGSVAPVSLILARPSLLPGSYLPSHYGPPMVLPPGMVTYPGWNPYQPSLTAMPSPGTQPSIGPSSVYGMAPLSPSGAAYTGTYQSGGPSSLTISKEEPFPQRPDQPECQYFMRTGDCKFGSSCRYHHPLDAVQPKTGVVLFSSIGLPLRPGVAQCTHFAQHGICKFGPACKFDHSMSSSLSYSPSASSLTDMPVAPYPIGSSSLSGASAPVSLSNEPTTEAVTAVSSPMVSGQEPAETSGDSASVSGSIEAKTSSSS